MNDYIPPDIIQIKTKIDQLKNELDKTNNPIYYKSINEALILFNKELDREGWEVLWYNDSRGVKKIN
jgi:hypothetical protein